MNNITLYGLERQKKYVWPFIKPRLKKVLSHGHFILGPEVYELEEKLAERMGFKHCITCNSGTDALILAMKACGISHDQVVATSTFTFPATINAIVQSGAYFVLCDVTHDGLINYDRPTVLEHVGSPIQFLMPVDLFGMKHNYMKSIDKAKMLNAEIIVDGAQAFGVNISEEFKNKIGAFCTSFFPTKILGCYGDGGAIFTNNESLADFVKQYRNHGRYAGLTISKSHNFMGVNSRLDTIQAAILLGKLELFDYEVHQRRQVALRYKENLHMAAYDKNETIMLPFHNGIWAQFPIHANDSRQREIILMDLEASGIEARIYYEKPIHAGYPLYMNTGFCMNPKATFPIADQASNTIFSIPMHAYLKNDEIDFICEVIDRNVF